MKSAVVIHSNSFVVRSGYRAESEFRSVAEAFARMQPGESVWIKTDGHGYFGPVVRP